MIRHPQHSILFTLLAVACTSLPAAAGVSLDDRNPISMAEPVTQAWEPLLKQGNHELTLSGKIDWDGFEDLDYDIRLGWGWFVVDGWEVGLTGSAADANDSRRYSGGFFTDYHFNHRSRFVPFVGVSAEWANLDFDVSELTLSKDSILLGAQVGVKYFISPNIAISTALTYSWATDDIFDSVDSFDDSQSSVLIGLRVYF